MPVFSVTAFQITPPAFSAEREIKAAPKEPTLEKVEQRTIERSEADRGRSLTPLPAPEVVHLKCPAKLVYHAAGYDRSDPELVGWAAQPVEPETIRVALRFGEVANLGTGWTGASVIECRYWGDGQKTSYSTTLTKKVHVSGTPYRCKVDRNAKSEVECRLSITPY